MNRFFVIASVLCMIISSCQQSGNHVDVSQDARFTNYITGFTSGIISKKDNITVRFANAVSLPDNPNPALIDLSPDVKGTIIRNGQSLIFSPEEALTSGTEYGVTIDLAGLLEVDQGLEQFVFAVNTIPMDYEVEMEGLRTTDVSNPKLLELKGTITTSDFVEDEIAEKLLNTSGKEIEWDHLTATSHAFVIKNIERTEESYDLSVASSGDAMGMNMVN